MPKYVTNKELTLLYIDPLTKRKSYLAINEGSEVFHNPGIGFYMDTKTIDRIYISAENVVEIEK